MAGVSGTSTDQHISWTAEPAEAGPYLRGGLAVLSAGAAVIHFEVMFEHFSEYWLYGTFFLVSAWAQLIWAAWIVWRPSRPMLWAGAVGNVAIVVVYVLTRTVGDLVGPGRGETEAVGGVDVVCTVFEVVLVAGALVLLWRRSGVAGRRIGRQAAGSLLAGIVVAVVAGTVAASLPALAGPEGPAGMSGDMSSGQMGTSDGMMPAQAGGQPGTPTPAATLVPSRCTASVRLDRAARGHFTATVSDTNTGTQQINGWYVTWMMPLGDTVTGGKNAMFMQSGPVGMAHAPDSDQVLRVRQTVRAQFEGTYPGATPPTFTNVVCG
jgi:cellulose binding protein with CBM2 domain